MLGALAGLFLHGRENRIRNYVLFGAAATIVYDAITGLGIGTLVFKQPFLAALTGQIPFTLYHLGGNLVLSALVSPRLYRGVVDNEQVSVRRLWHVIKGHKEAIQPE